MTNIQLNRTDLVNRASDFNGKLVSIEGTLVVEGDNSYLDIGDNVLVHVHDSDFMDRILDHVPCYVGGQYLYRDAGTLRGVLHVGNGSLQIKEIKRVYIRRDDQLFEF